MISSDNRWNWTGFKSDSWLDVNGSHHRVVSNYHPSIIIQGKVQRFMQRRPFFIYCNFESILKQYETYTRMYMYFFKTSKLSSYTYFLNRKLNLQLIWKSSHSPPTTASWKHLECISRCFPTQPFPFWTWHLVHWSLKQCKHFVHDVIQLKSNFMILLLFFLEY